jgi:parallel beta-helix repeat protein
MELSVKMLVVVTMVGTSCWSGSISVAASSLTTFSPDLLSFNGSTYTYPYLGRNWDSGDDHICLLLDLGAVPTFPVTQIQITNAHIATNWAIRTVNIFVATDENVSGFTPTDISWYTNDITGILAWDNASDAVRTMSLASPVMKRYLVLIVTANGWGNISGTSWNGGTSTISFSDIQAFTNSAPVTAGLAGGLNGEDWVTPMAQFGSGGFMAGDGNYDGVIRILVDQGTAKTFDRVQLTNRGDGAANYVPSGIRCLVAVDENAVGFAPLQYGSYTQQIVSGNLAPVVNTASAVRSIDVASVARRYILIEVQSNLWGPLDPDTNNQIQAGDLALITKPDTVDASTFGYDSTDATNALQAAINSGARVVNVPNMGTDWIVTPITLVSNQQINFASGVNVVAKRGYPNFQDIHSSLFNGSGLTNVKLVGDNTTFQMWKGDYAAVPYTTGEWRHGINLQGCSNVTISGITVKETGGDGIYLGSSYPDLSIPCSNITIQNVICDSNYRQGMSVTGVNGLQVENCIFRATSGTAPMAGIDFEPDSATEVLTGIMIKNCIFDANDTYGILIITTHLSNKSAYDALIENCTFYGNQIAGLHMTDYSSSLVVKDSLFVNNVCGLAYSGSTIFVPTYTGFWGNTAVKSGNITLGTGCLTTVQPVFASTTFGDDDYMYLASNCPAAIATGASDGSYMGARSKVAIPGDANGDGVVDVGDLGILAANYGTASGATWSQGDFNGDGAVDVGDLGILAANYGTGTSGADFNADYAKTFGTTSESTTSEDTTGEEDESSICSSLGLSLIAGLAMLGLMIVKLEE